MRSPTQKLAVAFWSEIGRRWCAGATVPPTDAKRSNREWADWQVAYLRNGGIAAYAHPIAHMPQAASPEAWMFDFHGRTQLDE